MRYLILTQFVSQIIFFELLHVLCNIFVIILTAQHSEYAEYQFVDNLLAGFPTTSISTSQLFTCHTISTVTNSLHSAQGMKRSFI